MDCIGKTKQNEQTTKNGSFLSLFPFPLRVSNDEYEACLKFGSHEKKNNPTTTLHIVIKLNFIDN